MNHDPAWVRNSTTRWLKPEEGIVAFGPPQQQVQLRPVEAAEGFSVTIGQFGGRPKSGPWEADALRDVRALVVDATGQLWIAEGGATPKRFSAWKTTTASPRGQLVREIFGPLEADAAPPRAEGADRFVAQGCRWQVDPASGEAKCLEVLAEGEARPH